MEAALAGVFAVQHRGGTGPALKWAVPRVPWLGLPSPSRHIYKSLTIAVAFGRSAAFDRVWQHPIKVDGTFA
jgi:hypothetical protein